jgi:hypothetical protein
MYPAAGAIAKGDCAANDAAKSNITIAEALVKRVARPFRHNIGNISPATIHCVASKTRGA